MKRYRVFYDESKVTGIVENKTSFTYTADNLIVGTISQIGVSLRTIGIDTAMIAEYEQIIEEGDNYVYVIIPSELIPSLVELSSFIEDVDLDNQFNVVLSKTPITTRNAATYNIPSDVLNMTPCKILKWENGDNAILQGIIDVWNSQEDYRIIEFSCKFDSLAELEAFKQLQK